MSGLPSGGLPESGGGESGGAEARALLEGVLATFRDAASPDVPAARLWAAAAPRFRSRLGGPEHLAHLFANPAWGPLLRHEEAAIETWDELEGAARATLRVTASDGTVVRYLASLVRRTDDGASAWWISGLVRAELADV